MLSNLDQIPRITEEQRKQFKHSPYVVLRIAKGVNEIYLPTDIEGKWIERRGNYAIDSPDPNTKYIAYGTDKFEIREDGVVAQVFEIRRS